MILFDNGKVEVMKTMLFNKKKREVHEDISIHFEELFNKIKVDKIDINHTVNYTDIENATETRFILIQLLSRKMTDNMLNMFYIHQLSSDISRYITGMTINKKRLSDKVMKIYVDGIFKENVLLLNVLYISMKRAMSERRICFKDEIHLVEQYFKRNNLTFTKEISL